MRKFMDAVDGYILILTLLFMPVFIGFSLLIVDVARGNNAHSDLQAAADAMALAGALELDQSPGAIANARAAMQTIENSVRMTGPDETFGGQMLKYSDDAGNNYVVIFLRDIPVNDDLPIDQAYADANATNDDLLAVYVYVRAVSPRDLRTLFFNPATFLQETTPISASAVATASTVICDFPPLYMCNPFEEDPDDASPATTEDWETHNRRKLTTMYNSGGLHARLIKLHPKGNNTERPGNFSFLQVPDTNGNSSASARTIRDYFAGESAPFCTEAGDVETKPGAAVSIRHGLNTRFDIYQAMYNNNGQNVFGPAANTRKGYAQGNNNVCSEALNTETVVEGGVTVEKVFGLADNAIMQTPSAITGQLSAPGAFVGSGNWPLDDYLTVNYRNMPNDAITLLDPTATQTAGTLDSVDLSNVMARFDSTNGASSISQTSIAGVTGGADLVGSIYADLLLGEDPSDTTPYNSAKLFTGGLTTYLPSRYDVYRWELAQEARVKRRNLTASTTNVPIYMHNSSYTADVTSGSPSEDLAETGISICFEGNGGITSLQNSPPPRVSRGDEYESDRRVIPVAIVDCNAPYNQGNGQTELKVNRFAKAFLVRPMEKNGTITTGSDDDEADGVPGANKDSTIDIEIVGLEGSDLGLPVDDVSIREAYLVR